MMNNSGTHGFNESPPNIVTTFNRPQSNASNINQNFSDFGKNIQQTSSSASGYYETHNFYNIGQPPVNIAPLIHPFQTYQNMGHGSPILSQNHQFSYENAMQNYFPATNTTTQADHSGMLSFNENFQTNSTAELQNEPSKSSYPSSKEYSLNIPQVPLGIIEKNSDIEKNDQNITDKTLTLPESVSQTSNNSVIEDAVLNSTTKLNTISEISAENIAEKPTDESQSDTESSKNLNQKPETTDIFPTIQKTTYNIVKNNRSSFKKTLTESKRKSLEKTVQLIESIINSNNKSEVIENNVDPLAYSSDPDFLANTSSQNSKDAADSDDEALIKKVSLKTKRKSSPKSLSSKEATTNSVEPTVQSQLLKIEIKDEPFNFSDVDNGNIFHRDCNGILHGYGVQAEKIVDMENSINEALASIKTGLTTNSYFECPHCCLLLHHPKRFLIHTKWHSFGLLNEKRAELVKKREERLKERREARLVLKLTPLAPGMESVRRYPCKDCDLVFPTKTGLKNHRQKLHSTEVTECRICLVEVRGMGELRAHMASHENGGLHQCPRCPKGFKYRHSLAKHVDTHREKTHSCSDCGKLFGSHVLVRLHMKTHERAARGPTHRCAYCGKGFYEAYNLQVHERTHRNDKPYQCDICESRFVTNSSLKRHVKVSHGGAKPYPCEVCKKCFASSTVRNRHELRVHSNQEKFTYQCKLCPKRYMKAKDLKNHTYRSHPKGRKKNVTSDAEESSP